MRIFKRFVIGFVVLFILFGVSGFFLFPHILKAVVQSKGSEALNRKLTVEKIEINPYKLTVKITGFSLTEPDGKQTFVSFKELFVNVNGSYSIAKRALVIEEVRVDGLYAGITRHPDNTYNFTDLIKEKKEPEPEKEPFHFSVSNIRLTGSCLDFRDEPVKAEHTVRDITLSVPFVSNIDLDVQSFVNPEFSARVNGHPFKLEGKTKPFIDSKSTSLDITLKDVDIPSYLKYVPVKLNGELASAVLDTDLKIDFVLDKKEKPALKLSGEVVLKDTVLKDSKKKTVFTLPRLAVAMAESEPLKSDIHVSRISVEKPSLVVERDKKGNLNLLSLLPKSDKKQKPAEKKAEENGKNGGEPLRLKIDECVLDSADIAFTDKVPRETAKIRVTPLTVKIRNFSNQKDEKADIDLSIDLNKKGLINITGPVCIDPVSADLALDLKSIAIRTFQPYFTDQIKIDVTKGDIGTKGQLNVVMAKDGKPKVTYDGEISVSRLATIDKARSNDFIKWRQLYFDRFKTGFNPFYLDIKGISLTDYYAKLVVNADGSMNVSDIFGDSKKEGKAKAPAEKPKETAKKKPADPRDALQGIKIGKISFQGGTVDFSDNKIKPNYSVTMKKLTGSVTGLSSAEISRAKVDLRGNFGYGSPVLIAGTINPLTTDLFLDLAVKFKDIELSSSSPYTSTYLGYPITKGKLDLAVSYFIDKGKIGRAHV